MSEPLRDFLLSISLTALLFASMGTVVLGLVFSLGYYQSCQEARIFNQQNATTWTCWDFMWASDQINSQTITLRHQKK
jgi:hypothetical protein